MSFLSKYFSAKRFKDPVCGMKAGERTTSAYQGENYYFCSIHCKQEFESNPGKYANHGE